MSRSRFVLGLTAAILLVGCSSGSDDAASGAESGDDSPRLLGVDEFAEVIERPDVVVINTHIPFEGDLPGTDLSIPFDEIAESDELPEDLDTPLAVYCRSDNMSADAVEDLDALGYTDVVELDGGFNAWIAEGRPMA